MDFKWNCSNADNPEMYEKVLIQTTNTDGDPVHSLAIWNGIRSGYIGFGGVRYRDVTHWARLPEFAD